MSIVLPVLYLPTGETLLDFSIKIAPKLIEEPSPVIAIATDLSSQQSVSVQVPQTPMRQSFYCKKTGPCL